MKLLSVIALAIALAGCSVRPIPDDVSPIPTEAIVSSMRCETKDAVRDRIQYELSKLPTKIDFEIETVLDPKNIAKVRAAGPKGEKLAQKLIAYGASAISYDFDFMITENNDNSLTLGFKLPFTNGNFDLGATGTYNLHRNAKRTFKTRETFADLAKLKCKNFVVRDPNLSYPITGSIGMRKAVHTFVELTELGGGKDDFTDTLTFTTTLSGSVTPHLTLNPVANSFRLVNAVGTVGAGRTDIHKVIVSFAFPLVDLREVQVDRPIGRARAVTVFDANALEQLTREAIERADENLCIARALEREDRNRTLRLYPPEIYCRKQFTGRPL